MIFPDLHICGELDGLDVGARAVKALGETVAYLDVNSPDNTMRLTISGTPDELCALLWRAMEAVERASREEAA